MVKTVTKRTFAVLLIFVVITGVFTAFFGTSAYAQTTYDDYLNSLIGDSSNEKPPIKKTGSYGSYAAIADYDSCLTETQENELLEILHDSAVKTKCNIGIVITKDLEGKTDARYSDIFSDEVFGNGSTSVVIMFLNTYNKPEYSRYVDQISADGAMTKRFKYSEMKRSFDRIYKKMGEPRGNKYEYNTSTKTYGGYDYYNACKEFARCVEHYGASGFAAIPAMFSDYVAHSFTKFAGGLAIAALITFVVVKSKVMSYKKKATLSAANYMDRHSTRVTRQVDQFVREFTTSHTHSSSSGGHGGGGGGGHGGGHSGAGGHHR